MSYRRFLMLTLLLTVADQGCRRTQPAPAAATQKTATPLPANVAAPAPWLLSYAGKDPSTLAEDKRFKSFLRTHVTNRKRAYWIGEPTAPSDDALEVVTGLGDDVRTAENRYVEIAACPPHDCVDQGLLWVDTVSGATVYALSRSAGGSGSTGMRADMQLFSNTPLAAGALPPPLLNAIARWTQQSGDPQYDSVVDTVTLEQPDGTQVKLTPADVHAWKPGMPVRSQNGGK